MNEPTIPTTTIDILGAEACVTFTGKFVTVVIDETAGLVINGIGVRARATLRKTPTGNRFHMDSPMIAYRLDRAYEEPTQNQSTKLYRAVIEGVQDLVAKNPHFLIEGKRYDLEVGVMLAEDAVEKAETRLHEAQRDLAQHIAIYGTSSSNE